MKQFDAVGKGQANAEGNTWDVVVIGGGPAGMMAAARAGERGRSVILLEKNSRLGKKLAITGGGRCNVTNNKPNVREMLSSYKTSGKFLFSTFMQHGVAETILWFATRGVPLVEENHGRLFPVTNSAETICTALVSELEATGAVVETKVAVKGISYDKKKGEFTISLAKGASLRCLACVVATGGTSRPDTGSTGDGFGWLSTLGHTVVENDLALVPLTLKDSWVSRVAGVTLDNVNISLFADGKKHYSAKGKILFTHVGVSGPTVLNMSKQVGELLKKGPVTMKIDLFPALDIRALRDRWQALFTTKSNQKVKNILSELIPAALAKVVLELAGVDDETPGHSVRSDDRKRLTTLLKSLPLTVKGLLGPDKAVVSSGGVALTEVDFKTMSSRVVPKLYLVGDVLDIERPSGGFSLQLCWSTGYVAGSHA